VGGFAPWDEDTTGEWFDLSVSAEFFDTRVVTF
jgi:hypothetical protein